VPDTRTPTREPERRAAGAAMPAPLPPVDIRRKRPPGLSFLLRMATLRRLTSVAALLMLDFAGVAAAILTALMVKSVIRDGEWAWSESLAETGDNLAFAYLVCALLFARSSR
jgi:hypothetical protein